MALDLLSRLDPLRRVRCPFCFERFAAAEMHFQCDDYACAADPSHRVDDPIRTRALLGPEVGGRRHSVLRSAWWVDPARDRRRGVRRFLDWVVLPASIDCRACGRPTTRRLCPRCHVHIPDDALAAPEGHVAIFGPQSVGKTTFITVLIEELDHRVGPRRGFILSAVSEEVRRRYEDEYRGPTYGSQQFGLGEELRSGVDRRVHSFTPPISAGNRAILQPLAFRLTRGGRRGRRSESLLSVFDTAGEDWEQHVDQLRAEARYLGRAGGLLFLVDPLRIRAVAHDPRIRLTPKESDVPPADYLGDARKLATFFPRTPVRVPLAVCLNKLDRWGPLLAPGTALRDLATRGPSSEPDAALDAAVHEEVRATLDRWGMAGFLEHVDLNFPRHRFFACSALGDAAQADEDAPQALPSPILVDRPVLWLLEEQGLLDRGGRR